MRFGCAARLILVVVVKFLPTSHPFTNHEKIARRAGFGTEEFNRNRGATKILNTSKLLALKFLAELGEQYTKLKL